MAAFDRANLAVEAITSLNILTCYRNWCHDGNVYNEMLSYVDIFFFIWKDSQLNHLQRIFTLSGVIFKVNRRVLILAHDASVVVKRLRFGTEGCKAICYLDHHHLRQP